MSRTRDGIGMTSKRTRARLVERLRSEGIDDARVLGAMGEVPRHLFVDEALASRAYEDVALPIGAGQTISQPYIVARMTAAVLGDRDDCRVLEIGTGCGYQTAILARLARRVYTVERLGALMESARERLRGLGATNVRYRHGDGFLGWPEQAPFDAILTAAAPLEVPRALPDQLEVGGRLVLPVGPHGDQRLIVIARGSSGFEERELERVSFVPLVAGLG